MKSSSFGKNSDRRQFSNDMHNKTCSLFKQCARVQKGAKKLQLGRQEALLLSKTNQDLFFFLFKKKAIDPICTYYQNQRTQQQQQLLLPSQPGKQRNNC
jgi:hypothetical protein